ncbi:hypothetical protein NDU88_003098 [Pleurodeles waltl]|uniref:Uncharacterized protein n=1 Tax=Pleurodeles waltl TaxID=8319 RepID=A0AAV7MUN7_PLEWA|nr:hypothetical protein NDU88_003098 [Pleurodeles waltl]
MNAVLWSRVEPLLGGWLRQFLHEEEKPGGKPRRTDSFLSEAKRRPVLCSFGLSVQSRFTASCDVTTFQGLLTLRLMNAV